MNHPIIDVIEVEQTACRSDGGADRKFPPDDHALIINIVLILSSRIRNAPLTFVCSPFFAPTLASASLMISTRIFLKIPV